MKTAEDYLRQAIAKLDEMEQNEDNNELYNLIESALFEYENVLNEMCILVNNYYELKHR